MVDSKVPLALASLLGILAWIGGVRGSWRCPSPNLLPHTTRMVPYKDKCYQFVHIETFWTSARNYCRQYGGRLVTIPDAQTNSFIIRTLNSLPWRNRGVWIGLHDMTDELSWEWSTESEAVAQRVTFTNWGRGHPRGFFHGMRDCVRMVRGSGTWKWHETVCAAFAWKYRSICQYDMRPTTSTSTTTTTTKATTTRTTPSTTTRRRPPPTTPTPTTPPTTAVLQYGVGLGANREGPDGDMRKDDKTTSTIVMTTEDEFAVDVVLPLRLKQKEGNDQNSILKGVIVVSLVAVALALVVIVVVYFRRRRQKKIAEDTITIANPMYAKTDHEVGGHQIVVGIDGQTTVLRAVKQPNVYTDEPIGTISCVAVVSAVTAENGTKLDYYEDMNYGSHTDQNTLNSDTERNTARHHATKIKQGRPMPATPTGQYLAMNGAKLPAIASPHGRYSGYEEPISHHRVSNLYAEIPELEDCPLPENLYESLDDIERNFIHTSSNA